MRVRWLLSAVLAGCGPTPHTRVIVEKPETRPQCGEGSVAALQVLGSGGPIPDDGRASAGYLVWVGGQSRALVDAGGGTFLRFGQAGASLDDLDVVLLSHLHTDHSADLPALLKGTFFGQRQRRLMVVGPSGDGPFPGLDDWLQSMFGPGGAYAYLGWLLDEDEGALDLSPIEIDHTLRHAQISEVGNVVVDTVGVEHGPVPALGFVVHVGSRKIAFAGDQNANNPAFIRIARGADILVMHHAVPEDADPVAARLHARPSEIGEIARQTEAGVLVLSHHMARSLGKLAEAERLIAAHYDGPVVIAEDLMCLTVP